jgi:hypothetical protein
LGWASSDFDDTGEINCYCKKKVKKSRESENSDAF